MGGPAIWIGHGPSCFHRGVSSIAGPVKGSGSISSGVSSVVSLVKAKCVPHGSTLESLSWVLNVQK